MAATQILCYDLSQSDIFSFSQMTQHTFFYKHTLEGAVSGELMKLMHKSMSLLFGIFRLILRATLMCLSVGYSVLNLKLGLSIKLSC